MNHDTHNHFRTFLLLGFWVLFLLYIRVPSGLKTFLWVLTALALFYQAYREHVATQTKHPGITMKTNTFAESINTIDPVSAPISSDATNS